MGVKECSRKGCDEIMCDRYSSEYGYLCNDCFDELVHIGVGKNIDKFMSKKKNSREHSYVFYDSIFAEDKEIS